MHEFLYAVPSEKNLRAFPTHAHEDAWEIVVYLRGFGFTEGGGTRAPFSKGTIACYPPGLAHSDGATRGTYDSHCFYFRTLDLDPHRLSVFQDESHGPFRQISSLLLSEYRLKRVRWQERCKDLGRSLLTYLEAWKTESHRHPAVLALERLLSEGIPDSEIKIHELLGRFDLSPFHLTRKFQKETGKSPRQYLLDLRLGAAADLLMKTRLPIHRIAMLAGFADEHYFSRIFSRRIGANPGAYRKKSQPDTPPGRPVYGPGVFIAPRP